MDTDQIDFLKLLLLTCITAESGTAVKSESVITGRTQKWAQEKS
jgi:hypothetical protein